MKRKYESFSIEKNYYKENADMISCIESEDEKKAIDEHIQAHAITPPSTSLESGYSALFFKENKININTSLLKKRKIGEHCLISRKENAPVLPVSCMASTEHVVAMGNKVSDFKSEFEPAEKSKVMYLILLSCTAKRINVQKEKKAIINLLKRFDSELRNRDIQITYHKEKQIFELKTATQIADIQLIVSAINSQKKYTIIDCEFNEIGLHEGVCLVKKDASTIHALVNIADSAEQKGFLERDAGTTSGRSTASYQDRKWLFNIFSSLKELREKAKYPEETSAIKIVKQ